LKGSIAALLAKTVKMFKNKWPKKYMFLDQATKSNTKLQKILKPAVVEMEIHIY
jgi:hypothetical protein